MKATKVAIAIFICACVVGCSSPNLYRWGDYQTQLHRYYDKPEKRLSVISKMESHIAWLESRDYRVPPGVYAEVGTFYLELGDEMLAIQYYKKEAQTWLESREFMQAMITNLESRIEQKEASDAL